MTAGEKHKQKKQEKTHQCMDKKQNTSHVIF